VEISARSGPGRTGIKASGSSLTPLARVTQLVQPQLGQVEQRIIKQATAFDPAIEGYVTYAIGGHGKRLRPLVALLAGGATGQINTGHVDLAVIVELIHVATLVHDDIIDEAERRRAQPSEICSGEMIQTQRRFDLKLEVEDYLRIVEMKTGSLFAAAAELGATISEADARSTEILKTFGMRVGTAYQIYDDCLDIAGNEGTTGKTLGTDLRKGKFTLPVLIFLRSASEFERERSCSLILEGKCDEVSQLLKNGADNGALSESITTASDLIRSAQAGMKALRPNAYTEGLLGLGDALRAMLEQLRT